MDFYSQNGQDEFISKLFKNKRHGFFLDIGAYDGLYYSNTLFFEKNFGWNGICIEPNPTVFNKLKVNRACTSINCCVSKEEGESNFLVVKGYGEMLSGLMDFFDKSHLIRIDKTVKEYGGSKEVIRIPVYSVKTILKDGIREVDYCNIDVEGGEISVLKSIDFSAVRIKVFTVENNYCTKEVKIFLNEKGYKLIGKLGSDEVYEYHSKRYGLIMKWRFEEVRNKIFLLSKSLKRRF